MKKTSTTQIMIVTALITVICVFAALALNQSQKTSKNNKNKLVGSPVITVIPTEDPSQKLQSNFQKTGNIAKNNPGFKKDTWYLLYDEPGSAGVKIELGFNNKSVCLSNKQNLPCPANFENGQKVRVEGNGINNMVMVKKLEVINAEIQVDGNKFIKTEWKTVLDHIAKCQVKTASQNPKREVTIILKDGTQIKTAEPKIDDIIFETQKVQKNCGIIPVTNQ